MQKAQTLILIALWAAPLLAFTLPRLAAALSALWRSRSPSAAAFALLALAACLYAYPSSADKGGGETNVPPAAPSAPAGQIRLYREDASGRLVPLGAGIREVRP
jgi:hypothetical protein